jgi:hypothetical protein
LRLFDAVDFHIEMTVGGEPSSENTQQIEQLQAKLTEIESATTRANRRFLTASGSLPAEQVERMQSDLQMVLDEFHRERTDVEKQLRQLRFDMDDKERIACGFENLKAVVAVRYPEGHRITEAFLGNSARNPKVERPGRRLIPGICLRLCETDRLRGLLKSLGAKAYIWWRPKAVRDKYGEIKRDASGEVCRSRRSFEVDVGQITAKFDLQDLAGDNATLETVTNISASTRGSTLKRRSSSSIMQPNCFVIFWLPRRGGPNRSRSRG